MPPCPQTMPKKTESLGVVMLAPTALGAGGIPVTHSVTDPNSLLPASAARTVNSPAPAGLYELLRVTSYVFDAEVTDCFSVLEYTYCEYVQFYDLVVVGQSIFRSPPSTTKVRDDGRLTGVCPEKILELLFSLGTKAIPNPFAFLALGPDGDGGGGADAALLASAFQTRPAFGSMSSSRISATAVRRVSDVVAVRTGAPASIAIDDLPSLSGGTAEISEVIADLQGIDTDEARILVGGLREAGRSFRVGDGVADDDAFVAIAGLAVADQDL